MKLLKLSFLFFSLSLIFASCSESSDMDEDLSGNTNTNEELVPVSFSLSNFKVDDITPFGLRSGGSINSDVKEIIYLVYKDTEDPNTDVLVKHKRITGDDMQEIIQDTLPKGNYHFCFLASSAYSNDAEFERVAATDMRLYKTAYISTLFYQNSPFNTSAFSNTECFYQNIDMSVESENAVQPVELRRFTSRIELKINDSHLIPSDIARIGIYHRHGFSNSTFYLRESKIGGALSLTKSVYANFGTDLTSPSEYQNLNTTPLVIDLFPITSNHPIDNPNAGFFILGFDDANNIIISKKLNIPLERNKITKISGDLYSDLGFTVSTNDEWDGENEIEF